MAVQTFSSNPSTATRHNLSRRQHGISGGSNHSGGSRQQPPVASGHDIGSGSTKFSKAEWGLHDLDDHIEAPNNDSEPSRKRTRRRRTLRRGIISILAALSIIALWTRSSFHKSGLSTAGSFDYTSDDDYWTNDSDKTTLPPRPYAPDEKYFILEYSPWLGFNNMRYMIERGLYLASLLNRTLILPNSLRLRSCSSSDESVCAQTATYLTPGSANSRNEQGSVFALDLGYFFELPHLAERMQGRVIGFRTFMEEVVGAEEERVGRLRDVDYGVQMFFALRSKKYSGGYRQGNSGEGEDEDKDMESKESKEDSRKGREIVLKTVQRRSWDLAEDPSLSFVNNVIRNGLVDTLDEAVGDQLSQQGQVQEDGSVHVNRSFYAFADVQGGGFGRIVDWSVQFQYKNDKDKAQDPTTRARHSKGRPLLDTCRPPLEEPSVDQIPWESRFPGFATCRIQNYVGLAQELGEIDADVLVVEGQFHTAGWIPMAHSSLENAQKNRRMALTYLRYSPVVHEAADYLMERLKDRILRRGGGGNAEKGDDSWLRLSMHVRRGDFVLLKHGWQNFDDGWMGFLVKDAVESVFGPFDPSLNLSSLIPGPVSEEDEETADDSSQDNNNNNNNNDQPFSRPQPSPIKIPKFGFYMSTDETSSQILDYFQSLGAILFEDLLDPYFESRFGHLIVFDDWIGLVEQLICARAAMFVGTMSSSFTSGILNLRLDPEAVDEEEGGGSGRKRFEYLYRKGGPVLTSVQQQQG